MKKFYWLTILLSLFLFSAVSNAQALNGKKLVPAKSVASKGEKIDGMKSVQSAKNFHRQLKPADIPGSFDFSAGTGTFNSIVSTGTKFGLVAGLRDDGIWQSIPIGFAFWFDGSPYATVAACCNGWLSFNSTTTTGYYGGMTPNNLVRAVDIYPFVAPLYGDLEVNGDIYYETDGTAPNRTFTVEWNNVAANHLYSEGYLGTNENSLSFQVVLYEATGEIQFVYTPGPDAATTFDDPDGSGLASGLVDVNGNFISVSALNASASISSTTENDAINAPPPEGLTFTFTPTVPPPSNLCLWLRADEGVPSSEGPVSDWADQSGNANDAMQSTSDNQPILESFVSAMNNQPAIHFNGSSSYMVLPASVTLGIQSHAYEFFIVARTSSASDATQFLIAGSMSQYEFHLNYEPGARFIPNGIQLDEGSLGSYSDGYTHVFSGRASSTGGAIRVDGVDGTTSISDLTSSDEGSLYLGRRSDATYYLDGDIAEVFIYNTVQTSAQRNSIDHYLANRYNITSDVCLPVQATNFFATADIGSVTLTWKTQSELNNAGFNILREEGGTSVGSTSLTTGFKLISSYTSNDALKGLGTSSTGRAYDFTDNKVTSGKTYQYKIQSVSTNGTTTDLTTLSVTVDVPKNYALYQNYPNPFNPSTTIRFDLKQISDVTLEIYNTLGQRVEYWNYGIMDAGRYNENINMTPFASGVYFYRVMATGVNGEKFVSKKKMLEMK